MDTNLAHWTWHAYWSIGYERKFGEYNNNSTKKKLPFILLQSIVIAGEHFGKEMKLNSSSSFSTPSEFTICSLFMCVCMCYMYAVSYSSCVILQIFFFFIQNIETLNAQRDTYVHISCFKKNWNKEALLRLCFYMPSSCRCCIWIFFVAVNISIFAKAYLHETLIITCARAIYTFTVVMWRGYLHVWRYLFDVDLYPPPHTYTHHPLRKNNFLLSAPNCNEEWASEWTSKGVYICVYVFAK